MFRFGRRCLDFSIDDAPGKEGMVTLGRTARGAGGTPAHALSHALRKHPADVASCLHFKIIVCPEIPKSVEFNAEIKICF